MLVGKLIKITVAATERIRLFRMIIISVENGCGQFFMLNLIRVDVIIQKFNLYFLEHFGFGNNNTVVDCGLSLKRLDCSSNDNEMKILKTSFGCFVGLFDYNFLPKVFNLLQMF